MYYIIKCFCFLTNKQMWFQEAASFERGSALKQWTRTSSTSWVSFPSIVREWHLSSTWEADQKTFSWLRHKPGQCWHVQESELRLWSGCTAEVFQVLHKAFYFFFKIGWIWSYEIIWISVHYLTFFCILFIVNCEFQGRRIKSTCFNTILSPWQCWGWDAGLPHALPVYTR